jgi:hypothetical protein
MILLTLTFIAEFVVAYLCYLVLRKYLPTKSLVTIVLISSLVGLPGGWAVAYRVTAGNTLNQYYGSANSEYRRSTGRAIPMNEWLQIAERLQGHPDYYFTLYKGAAIHAIPAFIISLAVLGYLARRRERRRNNADSKSS